MRTIFLVFLMVFSASALFCQNRTENISKVNISKLDKKYLRLYHGRPMTTKGYFKRQEELDNRIKKLEFDLAELKKRKSDLKREYLNSLDEKIKMQDADIERLKKEKSEVLSAKSAVRDGKRGKRTETLDSRLNEKKREAEELKKLKESVDTSKTE